MSHRRIRSGLAVMLPALAGLLAAGCSGVVTSHDYDTTYDFTTLHTYDWGDVTAGPEVNPLSMQRAEDAIDRVLQARGYAPVASGGDPDFVLVLSAGRVTERAQINPRYDYDRSISYSATRPSPQSYEYEEGRMQLDIVDHTTHRLIWRGNAAAVIDPTLSPEQREQRINDAVEKLLAKFPPSGGG